MIAGEGEALARDLNRPYLTLLRFGRPYVHAKWAMSLDGKIATRTGHSQWISGAESRRRVHELRGRMDAIVVGAGTVRADDPLLTARPPGPRVAARVVLSSTGTLPAGCRLLATAGDAPVVVATLPGRGDDARRQGCEVLELPAQHGRLAVAELLRELGRRRMTNVLVEGGAGVLGSFHDAGLIDELHVFVAPILIGGTTALSPVSGLGLDMVGAGRNLTLTHREMVEDDFYLNARYGSADEPA